LIEWYSPPLSNKVEEERKKAAGPMCKTLPRESLSPMRINKVFGQDKKGLKTLDQGERKGLLTPRDKS